MTAKSLLVVGTHLPLFAQQTEVLAFDVASIKLARPDSGDRSIYNFPGRLTVANLGIRSLIESAYRVLPEQILGAPSWVDSARYDIDARCEELPSLKRLRDRSEAMKGGYDESKRFPISGILSLEEAKWLKH
jgi:hypothetical protein